MQADREANADTSKGWYIYGILPADCEVTDSAAGIGGPAARLELVTAGKLGALVSELAIEGLGTPDDLLAHQRLLDEIAAEIPVLPLRFGAVLTDYEAITDELLLPNHDEFATALTDVTGRVEYLLRARYAEQTILREVLTEVPGAQALQQQIRDMPAEASRDYRIRLGEIINQTIETKRREDTERLIELLGRHCVAVADREPAHEEDAANIAMLVDVAHQDALVDAVDQVAADWSERAEIRLLGPVAPYDFVPQGIAEGEE
jgi:Gas vesicle synthesis protein GvpL/GvpF